MVASVKHSGERLIHSLRRNTFSVLSGDCRVRCAESCHSIDRPSKNELTCINVLHRRTC